MIDHLDNGIKNSITKDSDGRTFNQCEQRYLKWGDGGVVTCWTFQVRVDVIDEYSRLLFPLSFATFNAIYWLLFLQYRT